MVLIYLAIPVGLFILNEFYNNKIFIFMNKFYKCCKLLIAIIPILLIFFNKDFKNDILLKFKKLDSKTDLEKMISIKNIKKNNVKRNVSESKKKYVASNQQWKCKKCNHLLDATYEIDHKVPLYKGGSNEIDNLEALCRNCHGNKTLLDRFNN